MKLFWTLPFLLWACGSMELLPFDSLTDEQPKVVSVTPSDGENAYDGNNVEVVFNQPIDPKTVTTKSFLITAVEEGEVDIDVLWDKTKDEELQVHPGAFEISEDQKTVRFVAAQPFPPDIRCGVLITPEIFSIDRLPLNQTPGEGPTPFFSSFYAVDGENGSSAAGPQTSEVSIAQNVPRPSFLVLNEVFYDALGSDANGDLFVELYGEAQRNITGYQILIVRGDDGVILDTLRIPSGMQTNAQGFFVIADAVTNQPGQTHVENADWVENFDPPNGPDCIQLVDPNGNLVDALGYGSPLVLRAQNNLLCYEGEPAPDVPSGSSLARLVATPDTNNNSSDWMVSATVP